MAATVWSRGASSALPPPPLKVNPSGQVIFTGPFHRRSRSHVSLQNLSFTEALAFKIKSTAMKGQIAVHPCTGVINPRQSLQIQVTLTPSTTAKSGTRPPMHQILIQTVSAEKNSEYGNHVWQRGFKHNSYKLKCVYQDLIEECQDKAEAEPERIKKTVVWCDSVPITKGNVTHLTAWNQHVEIETCVDPNQAFISENHEETTWMSRMTEIKDQGDKFLAQPNTINTDLENIWAIVDEQQRPQQHSDCQWNPKDVATNLDENDPWNDVEKGDHDFPDNDKKHEAEPDENNDQTQWMSGDVHENNAWEVKEAPEIICWPQTNTEWSKTNDDNNFTDWDAPETICRKPHSIENGEEKEQRPIENLTGFKDPADSLPRNEHFTQMSGKASLDDAKYAPVNIVFPVGVIEESLKLMFFVLCVGIIVGKWFI